jgi:hypothetical protein
MNPIWVADMIVFLMALSGPGLFQCQGTQGNADKVKAGMTEKEVDQILGPGGTLTKDQVGKSKTWPGTGDVLEVVVLFDAQDRVTLVLCLSLPQRQRTVFPDMSQWPGQKKNQERQLGR